MTNKTPKPKEPTVETITQYNVDFGDELVSISGNDAKSEKEALKLAQEQYDKRHKQSKEG